MTARRHGATVVTAKRSDVDVLARELRMHLLAARPVLGPLRHGRLVWTTTQTPSTRSTVESRV
jgi:hypothetical protein